MKVLNNVNKYVIVLILFILQEYLFIYLFDYLIIKRMFNPLQKAKRKKKFYIEKPEIKIKNTIKMERNNISSK